MALVPPPPSKPTVVLDIECYRNYFLVVARNHWGVVLAVEAHDGNPLTTDAIIAVREVMRTCRVVTFNGRNYDLPVLMFALLGHGTVTMKSITNEIILGGAKPWEIERKYGLELPPCDHVDLMEVAPGQGSLKIYAGRLHSKRLQDLPVDPEADLTPEQKVLIKDYCANSDCVAALDLLDSLKPQLDLRDTLTAQYGIDLRSKSDAQIAESVIKQGVEQAIGGRVYRPEIAPGTAYRYAPPAFVRFDSPHLNAMLEKVRAATFRIAANGSVEMPPELDDLAIPIGTGVYRMGIGGLHSSEKCVSYVADADTLIIDRDVTSYYPSIILNCRLAPKHLGQAFLDVYRGIVDRRIAAKRSGNKVVADSLKITINGSFGKLGSMWSALYSPDLMIQVTVTGQLCLMMFIEMVEAAGIHVISANTDGVVMHCPRSQYDVLNALVQWWETVTGFETEETRYRALFSRDVNNYVAIKPDGKVKTKGAFNTGEVPLMKNPGNNICLDAAIAYLADAIPIEYTVYSCTDIRQFVTLRKVQGGGQWNGGYLGKTVRWIYTTNGAPITYVKNGNKVARSDGCTPVMDLPDALPTDTLDYEWYIRETRDILRDMGVTLCT